MANLPVVRSSYSETIEAFTTSSPVIDTTINNKLSILLGNIANLKDQVAALSAIVAGGGSSSGGLNNGGLFYDPKFQLGTDASSWWESGYTDIASCQKMWQYLLPEAPVILQSYTYNENPVFAASMSAITEGTPVQLLFRSTTNQIAHTNSFSWGANSVSAVAHTGEGLGVLTVSGTTDNQYVFLASITTTGGRNAGVFHYSLDNGINWSSLITIPTSGDYVVGTTGLTIHFSDSEFTVSDTYTFYTLGVTPTIDSVYEADWLPNASLTITPETSTTRLAISIPESANVASCTITFPVNGFYKANWDYYTKPVFAWFGQAVEFIAGTSFKQAYQDADGRFAMSNTTAYLYGNPTIAFSSAQPPLPALGEATPVNLALTLASRTQVSPLIYGVNSDGTTPVAGIKFLRGGGNRLTAYNWTNNYSNAGVDYLYENDELMGTLSDGPGKAFRNVVEQASVGAMTAVQLTVQVQGKVAKDAAGPLSLTDPDLATHFIDVAPAKGSAFTLTPDGTETTVYQDEIVNYQKVITDAAGVSLIVSMDNEPDIWRATHPEIQLEPLTYAALIAKHLAAAEAIKTSIPTVQLSGPINYGIYGYISLQGAADAPVDASLNPGKSFLSEYLQAMSTASGVFGSRLLDVLDVHYYSEAQSSTGEGAGNNNSDACVGARSQAVRSLDSPTYIESSWITSSITNYSTRGTPLQIITRLQDDIIAVDYPDTKLAITEYNFGAKNHIVDAVAQTDALGIFARKSVHVASLWHLGSEYTFQNAGFKPFLKYDGVNAVGDYIVSVDNTDDANVSVYAYVPEASGDPSKLVLVITHRTSYLPGYNILDSRSRDVTIDSGSSLSTVKAWRMSGASTDLTAITAPSLVGGVITMTLPAMSVTVVELS